MIGRILQQILDKETKVAVPGLGVFFSTYLSSEIQFAAKSILPPSRQIEFNQRGKTEGENQLRDYLVNVLEVSVEQAEFYIHQFASEAQQKLNSERKFDIPQFGSLALDIEGNVVFLSNSTVQYNAESFGLTPVSAETVFSKTRQTIVREVPVIPLHPFDDEIVSTEEDARPGKRNIRWMGMAAAVTALLITLGSVFMLAKFTDNDSLVATSTPSKPQEAGIMPMTTVESSDKVSSEPSAPASVTEVPVVAAEQVVEKVVEVKSVKDTTLKVKRVMYFVIAGSFKEFPRVQKLSNQLQGKGYNISIHHIKDIDFTRLAIGGFPTKEEAIAFMTNAQKDFPEPLWVFTDPNSVLSK